MIKATRDSSLQAEAHPKCLDHLRVLVLSGGPGMERESA
jgi:hypothetical protein